MNIREYLTSRKNSTVNNSIMTREVGEINSLVDKPLTIDRVESHYSKSDGLKFYVFTIVNDEHFYFAPTVLRKQIIEIEEAGFKLTDLSGLDLSITVKKISDEKFYYNCKLS